VEVSPIPEFRREEARMAERLITDIGGLPDGAVPREEVPQLFWEKHMIAMFNVLRDKGVFNLDELRRSVEGMRPDDYKHSTFYGRRLDGMTDLLVEKGVIDRAELAARAEKILREGTRDHA
jgi:nitrile hydratase subunit beta